LSLILLLIAVSLWDISMEKAHGMSMIHCKIAPISSLTRRSDLGG